MIMSQKLAETLFKIGILNFLVFVVLALAIGGDALNGHEANGHYYLANHGELTEVCQFVFIYSQVHAMSLFITHPLAMIGGFMLWYYRIP